MDTPLPYYGAKKAACKRIVKYLPKHDLYVEPMCGSAAVFFGKELAEYSVLSDINPWPLLGLRAVRDHPNYLYSLLPSEIDDVEYKQAIYSIKNNNIYCDDVVDARTMIIGWYSSFNISPWSGSRSKRMCSAYKNNYNKGVIKNDIDKGSIKLQDVYIQKVSVLEQLNKYSDSNTLFFLDPPYCYKNNSGGSRGSAYKGYGPYDPDDDWHDKFLDKINEITDESKIVITTGNDKLYKDRLGKMGFDFLTAFGTNNSRSRTLNRNAKHLIWKNKNVETFI